MMVGDGGKKGKGDDENSEQMDEQLVPSSEKPQEIHDELEKIADTKEDLGANSHNLNYVQLERLDTRGFLFVAPREGQSVWALTSYNQVTEEETVAAYVYKMDRPWLRPDEVRVEIRRGRALWVIGQGDEPVKSGLPSLKKMRVSKATASMNADCVLTIAIPKSHRPWKWYQYKDLVFRWFKMVHVAVSS